MKRLSFLALVFAILSLTFIILLIFFRSPFHPYPLLSYQDALDLLTPLILIPIYWRMFKSSSNREASSTEEIVFMVFAAIWVLGHGMHLAANSLDNLIEGLAKQKVIDVTGTSIYQLAYFTDEHLSHYFWHIGVLGLAALIIYREWRNPAGSATVWWEAGLAGVIYGFTYFCIFLEGQTVPLGLPFAAALSLVTFLWGRKKIGPTAHPCLFLSVLPAGVYPVCRLGAVLGRLPAVFGCGLDLKRRLRLNTFSIAWIQKPAMGCMNLKELS